MITLSKEELLRCCGSSLWVEKMLGYGHFSDLADLKRKASLSFDVLKEQDWLEAFSHHPMIGDVESLRKKFASTAKWAGQEQGSVQQASEATLLRLAEGNKQYLQKNGFIFIVCATGKSADEMLVLLEKRLANIRSDELKNAAEEQKKITQLRLEKALNP